MNVGKITGYILAIALITLTAGVITAGEPDRGGPYTGPDGVMTSAPSADITRFDGASVIAMEDTMLSVGDAATSATALARFGKCSTLTFSSNGQDTAISSNEFADPFLSGDTSFVCQTY
jgi:hypothetical protein